MEAVNNCSVPSHSLLLFKHTQAESLSKLSPALDYVRAHPHVKLHLMALRGSLSLKAAFRRQLLATLGLDWTNRVVTGCIRARVVHLFDQHECGAPHALGLLALREHIRRAVRAPMLPIWGGPAGVTFDEEDDYSNLDDAWLLSPTPAPVVQLPPTLRKRSAAPDAAAKVMRQQNDSASGLSGRGRGGSGVDIRSMHIAEEPLDKRGSGRGLLLSNKVPRNVAATATHNGTATRSTDVLRSSTASSPAQQAVLGRRTTRRTGANRSAQQTAVHGAGVSILEGGAPAVTSVAPRDATALAGGSRPVHVVVMKRSHARRIAQHDEFLRALRTALPAAFITEIDDAALPPQAAIFRAVASADVLLGAHGAGMANAIVSPSGTCIIEVMPRDWHVLCYLRLASLFGLRYNNFVVAGDRTSTMNVHVDRVVAATQACIAARSAAVAPAMDDASRGGLASLLRW